MEHVLQVVEEDQYSWEEEENKSDTAEGELGQEEELEDVEEAGHYGHHGEESLCQDGEDGVEVSCPGQPSAVQQRDGRPAVPHVGPGHHGWTGDISVE